MIAAGKSPFYKVCGGILFWETFTGKLFRKKCRDIFPGNFGRNFPRKSFPPFCENTGDHPLGETSCYLYTYCVYNTRLERVFNENHSMLLRNTVMRIILSGSFLDFPEFSGGRFHVGSFPGIFWISRNSPGEGFTSGVFPYFFKRFTSGSFPRTYVVYTKPVHDFPCS